MPLAIRRKSVVLFVLPYACPLASFHILVNFDFFLAKVSRVAPLPFFFILRAQNKIKISSKSENSRVPQTEFAPTQTALINHAILQKSFAAILCRFGRSDTRASSRSRYPSLPARECATAPASCRKILAKYIPSRSE